MRIRLLLASLATLAAPVPGLAQAIWIGGGPDGGGVGSLVADPGDADTIYASTVGGIFRSSDAGAHWALASDGLYSLDGFARPLIADADQSATLYFASRDNGVYRTTDGGLHWGQTGYVAGPAEEVNALVDEPGTSGHLYLLTKSHGLLYTSDGGLTLVQRNTGLPATAVPTALAIAPQDHQVLLTGTQDGGVYRSSDGGASWQSVSITCNACGFRVSSLVFGLANRAYVAWSGQIHWSDDLGVTWYSTGFTGDVTSLLPDKVDIDRLLIGRNDGIWLSVDGAKTFAPLNSGLIVGATSTPRVTTIVAGNASPADPRVWIGTDNAGVFASANTGQTWVASNAGLAAATVRAVAIHPALSTRIYAGYSNPLGTTYSLPFYISNDGAASWDEGGLTDIAGMIRTITIDPTTASTVSTTHLYAGGRFGPGPVRNGGIYKSLDGGASWNVIDAGLPCCSNAYGGNFIGTVRNIVLDPRSCDNPPSSGPCSSGPLKTVYATADGFHLYGFNVLKSVDAGATWTQSNTGLPQPIDADVFEVVTPLSLTIDAGDNQVLYLGTFDSLDTSDVFGPPPPASLPSGVFRSDDGGAHWYQRSDGLPRKQGSADTSLDVLALVADEHNPGTLWAAVTEADVAVPSTPSRIYKTTDGGATWNDSSIGLIACEVRALKADPASANVIYAGGYALYGGTGCLYRSDDAGAHWNRFDSGLRADAVLAIDLDPQDSTHIVVGTNSGVYVLLPDPIFANGFD